MGTIFAFYIFPFQRKTCTYIMYVCVSAGDRRLCKKGSSIECNSIPHSYCRCVSLNWHQLPVKLPALSSLSRQTLPFFLYGSFLQTASRKWANTLRKSVYISKNTHHPSYHPCYIISLYYYPYTASRSQMSIKWTEKTSQ